MTAFAVAGVSLAAGLGTASAASTLSAPALSAPTLSGPALAGAVDPGRQVPGTEVVCLLPLPLLCDEPSGGPQPGESPQDRPSDSWSSAPQHEESWSEPPTREGSRPGTRESEPPWRPAGEEEHRVPKGHPETGGGALAASGGPVWPFAVGGAALLAGAGLAGFAARRTSRPAPPE
ncbi:hypothetical protein AB0C27_16770 [Nonomuraea sp. NPDC048882]|uniref:hypothetical protein n=1 Tax=unclassified Nonomuraea TaxID=2593643 RepID=UPI00340E789E